MRDSEINSSGALLSGPSQLRNEATGGEQVDPILTVQGKEQGMSVTRGRKQQRERAPGQRGSRAKCRRRAKTSCSSDDSSVEKTQRRQSLSRKRAQYRKEGRTQSIRSASSSSSSSDYSIVDDETDSTDSSDWDETSSIDTSFEGVKTPRESRLLPPFTGQNEKWEVWFAHFEDLAENHHWTKAEHLSALVPLLHKKAGEFVFGSVSRRVRTNYKKLISELHMWYRTVESKKSYKLKWAELKQTPGQSIEELAAHVKWLHDKAFPDRDRKTRKEDLVSKFFDALNDTTAKAQVQFVKDPDNIDDAVMDVIHYGDTYKLKRNEGRTRTTKTKDCSDTDDGNSEAKWQKIVRATSLKEPPEKQINVGEQAEQSPMGGGSSGQNKDNRYSD